MKIIVVIPARFSSERLPGKPLKKIKGIPMILRTYFQCNKVFKKKQIIVATDNLKIKKLCLENDINVLMTSKKCMTGTDRVAEVAKKIIADVYINVQGDEPFFNPVDLKKLLKNVLNNPSNIYNGYTKIDKINLYESSSIPKVVFDNNENLLYMSRGKIPSNKKHKFESGWRQVCAYAFPRKDLIKFKKLAKKTQLEKIEDIEILRFLEMGKKIKMVKMSNKSISIDTKKDLKKANSNSLNSK
tara:strand:+ start:1062 stop:1790 length:729 start_codon:yes stop_codon:yes gene_type:complete